MDVFAEHRDMIDEQYLAVIDTETNMFDEVISVAVVVAHKETYQIIEELSAKNRLCMSMH